MRIYPAIDLMDGRCVRLKQGGFDQSTAYSDDPVQMAATFAEAGATHLHLVDLSGARDPATRQVELIERVIRARPPGAPSGLRVQVGGGIRKFEQAAELLSVGADRVVIGSAAVSTPQLVLDLLSEFGADRVTVALDVRLDEAGLPRVALYGWKDQSAVEAGQALAPLLAGGLKRVLCTDISRDGMMAGPNIGLYQGMSSRFPGVEFQASGGVSCLEDLLALRAAGTQSVVVGKAIYEGAVDLRAALQRCGGGARAD